jgi:hypothetical protein
LQASPARYRKQRAYFNRHQCAAFSDHRKRASRTTKRCRLDPYIDIVDDASGVRPAQLSCCQPPASTATVSLRARLRSPEGSIRGVHAPHRPAPTAASLHSSAPSLMPPASDRMRHRKRLIVYSSTSDRYHAINTSHECRGSCALIQRVC